MITAFCVRYGADLCYTPMYNSKLFHQGAKGRKYRRGQHFTVEGDRPLIAQFCGNDPKTFLGAARTVEHEVDAIDMNLGCPQGIAKKGYYGSFLLENVPLLQRMGKFIYCGVWRVAASDIRHTCCKVSTLRRGLNVPVTCKIRILPDDEETIALALALQDAGCSVIQWWHHTVICGLLTYLVGYTLQILTVHGRTKEQNKQLMGANNFDIIKRIK